MGEGAGDGGGRDLETEGSGQGAGDGDGRYLETERAGNGPGRRVREIGK